MMVPRMVKVGIRRRRERHKRGIMGREYLMVELILEGSHK